MNEKSISLTELRKTFENILNEVEQGTPFVVTRYKKPVAILVPFVEAPQSIMVEATAVEAVLEAELPEETTEVLLTTDDISSFG